MKLSPIRFFWIHATLQSWTVAPLAMTRRNRAGTNAGQKKSAPGLNENYARELMELHTLAVNGGYTQQDVVELAKVLTGTI